jgi:tetratricopeptide (TPR) repeat protein
LTSDRPKDIPNHLQQELLKNIQVQGNLTTGDITQIGSQFVIYPDKSPKPTGIPQNLPRSGVSNFVGREEALATLHQQLRQREHVAISAIAGMGGVGKTELALQYAHLHWQQQTYPGGVCWLIVRELDLGTQIVTFARAQLQLHPPDDLDLPSQVAFCWRHWLPGEVLLVLDDVTDYEEVKPYLPPVEPRFKVLITTRVQLGAPIVRLDLDVLTKEAALSLLKSLVGDERVEAELKVAQNLCEWLGYLPLGLELLGRYLVLEEDLSLAEVQQQLTQARLEDEALVEAQPEMTAHLGVAAAFELSWKRLDENAQVLGYLLSLFALAPIPWSLVESAATGQDIKDLQKAKRILVQFNLMKRTQKDTYQLHQLIREFFSVKREQSALADDLKWGFCQAIVAVAKEIPQTPTLEQIAAVKPTIPHLAEAATDQKDWLRDEDLIIPFVALGSFYGGQGVYDLAEPWFEQCLFLTRTRLGEEHPYTRDSLNNLAELYHDQGRYSEAEPLHLQALDLSDEPSDVAISLNNLAKLYKYQGRYSDAEFFYIQALALWERLPGQEHRHFALCLSSLAVLYKAQGRYREAERLLVQALELSKYLLGEQHLDVATNLNNLAACYCEQGRYSEAEPLYLQALELWKRLLGEDHPNVATSLNNFGYFYVSQGRYREAEPLLVQALELRKRLLGEEHPDVATSLTNVATLYCMQSRYREAESIFVQALDLKKRLLGEEHPNVAQNMANLATLYCMQSRYCEAESLLVKALRIAEKRLGSNHPDTIIMRQGLQNLRDRHAS